MKPPGFIVFSISWNFQKEQKKAVAVLWGEVLIVGAPGEDANGDDAGAAYVYLLSTRRVWWNSYPLVMSK